MHYVCDVRVSKIAGANKNFLCEEKRTDEPADQPNLSRD